MDNAPLPFFVAIGASGSEGLQDVTAVLHALPRPVAAIIMVVLHRSSERVSYLKEVLDRNGSIPVVIAEEEQELRPGTCYIGEPGAHLTLIDTNLAHLVNGKNHEFRNRTIDMLFGSLALHAGRRVVGVVLSGALDDGSRGLAAIHKAHGLTMVLDPGHNKPVGMQQNAIDYDGPISFIGSARNIAEMIGRVAAEHTTTQ